MEINSSRLKALLEGKFTKFIFPHKMGLFQNKVYTIKVKYFFFPWIKEKEFIDKNKISSIIHNEGFLWDSIIIETLGNMNILDIIGVSKKKAKKILSLLK